MKQTPVEFLEEKFKNSHANFINWSLENFEQAKEMEKQQQGYSKEEVINAFNEGQALNVRGKLIQGKEWFEQFKNK